MKGLSKKKHDLIRSLFSRHGRKKSEFCVCEGVRCCRELISLRPDLIQMAICAENADTSNINYDFDRISQPEFESLATTINSQGVIVIVAKPGESEFESGTPFIIVLDKVSDPGNCGTIFRTARAAGLKEIWLTEGTADPYNDKIIRSATASQFALNIRKFRDLGEVKESLEKYAFNKIYRTDPHQGANCFTEKKLFDKSAIIFGSEGSGAGDIKGAESVTIPMPGKVESINVAQAATIIIFEFIRRNSCT